MEAPDPTLNRRGRLPTAERATRERELLDAARAMLVAHGYDRMTMSHIAQASRASKQTLYAWFGSKEALVTRLIETDADVSARRVTEAIAAADQDRAGAERTLTAYAIGLLSLLTSGSSVALNRAAMTSPDLAAALLRSGRHRVGPIVRRYLASLDASGTLDAPDPEAAFQLLYGLVVRDIQIRVLLGEAAPSDQAIRAGAKQAVRQFLELAAPPPTPGDTNLISQTGPGPR